MLRMIFIIGICVCFCVGLTPADAAQAADGADAAQAADDTGKPKVIYWQNLLPENEDIILDALQKQQNSTLGALDHAMGSGGAQRQLKSFNVVQDYDGKKVKLPGFVVPLEFAPTGEVSEFLFVPYQGACVHLPPPPPNQIVYAKAKEKTYFGDMWSPIWLVGTLRTKQFLNDMGDAAYTLEIDSWEQYLGRE